MSGWLYLGCGLAVGAYALSVAAQRAVIDTMDSWGEDFR